MIHRLGPAVSRLLACALLACAASQSSCQGSGSQPGDEDAQATVAPLIERAERQRDRGDYDGAIAAYEQALAKTPWNDRVKHALAMTYAERGRQRREEGLLGQSEADLRKALEIEPEHPGARQNLAVVLVERAALDVEPERAQARRAEAESLTPGISAASADRDGGLERRLDLAYELLERGQLGAGIDRLVRLHERYPDEPQVSRLLVQALTLQGTELSEGGNYVGAGEALDRAVAVSAAIPGCRAPEWAGCSERDVNVAHYNRVIAWMEASEPSRADGALRDAEGVGLEFPELRAEIDEQVMR